MIEWHDYVVEMREQELVIIIEEERLKEDETLGGAAKSTKDSDET